MGERVGWRDWEDREDREDREEKGEKGEKGEKAAKEEKGEKEGKEEGKKMFSPCPSLTVSNLGNRSVDRLVVPVAVVSIESKM